MAKKTGPDIRDLANEISSIAVPQPVKDFCLQVADKLQPAAAAPAKKKGR